MQVAGSRLNATANNTANMNTQGYRRYEAQGMEAPDGVKVHVRRSAERGANPVGDAIELKGAYLMYVANLKVVDRADEMLGQTMDLLA